MSVPGKLSRKEASIFKITGGEGCAVARRFRTLVKTSPLTFPRRCQATSLPVPMLITHCFSRSSGFPSRIPARAGGEGRRQKCQDDRHFPRCEHPENCRYGRRGGRN